MRITYVTQDTELWGGIAVVFQHLELLTEGGHDAFLTTPAGKPDWYPLKVPIHTMDRLDSSLIPAADLIVATSWRTITPVVESGKGIAVHLCQGYEGAYKEFSHLKADIDKAYSHTIPRLTVSPHLNTLLAERFAGETYYVGQMLNPDIFYASTRSCNPYSRVRLNPFNIFKKRAFRVLVVGPFEVDFKNIATALKGISLARDRYRIPLKLIRASQFPITEDEQRTMKSDEYHLHIAQPAMGELYRSVDLFISSSKDAEGFGLPALEAMACGVPTILSTISSYMSFGESKDYSLFVDASDHRGVADAINRIFHDERLRQRLKQRGLEVAGSFTKGKVMERLIAAFNRIKQGNNPDV